MANKPDTNFLSGTAKPGPYVTQLPFLDELKFKSWVQRNNIPFDPLPTSDYDMRGFYKALISGDPRAATAISPFDNAMHFPDVWKTPFHNTFSNESMYATPNAPGWQGDVLKNKLGSVIADETPKK